MWKRIDKDIEKAISSLSETEKVEFDKLEREKIQAIAFNKPHRGLDGTLYWTDLGIFNDPFILSEESYKSLNPIRNIGVKNTKILTFDHVGISKSEERERIGLLDGLWGKKPEKYNVYWIRNHKGSNGTERIISSQEKVIPIYQDNPDYQRIMDFIKEKEGK